MKNKAFTLIELLVVIVIIGILATVSTATFDGASEKAKGARIVATINELSTHVQNFISIKVEGEEIDQSIVPFLNSLATYLGKQGFTVRKEDFYKGESCIGINMHESKKDFYTYAYAPGSPNNVAIGGADIVRQHFRTSNWSSDWIESFGDEYIITPEFTEEGFNCVTGSSFLLNAANGGAYDPFQPDAFRMTSLRRAGYKPDADLAGNETRPVDWSVSLPLLISPETGKICGEINYPLPSRDAYCSTDSLFE